MDVGQSLATQELAQGRSSQGLPGMGHHPNALPQHPLAPTDMATSPPLCRAPAVRSEQTKAGPTALLRGYPPAQSHRLK